MIAEPFTSLTDYGIALECLLFAGLLGRKGRSGWLWAAAFVSVSVAAISGGTYHGFASGFSLAGRWLLWRGTVWALAVSSFFILLAAVSKMPGAGRIALLAVATVQLTLSLHLGSGAAAFAVSVADYLSALAIALVVQDWRSRQQRCFLPVDKRSDSGFAWMVLGLSLSGAAIAILILPWPNALKVSPLVGYHLIQMVALYCIYRSARADVNCSRVRDERLL